jgi:hypothetical protein
MVNYVLQRKEELMSRELSSIVRLGESSVLKSDLNYAVACLAKAEESHFQPHICLNTEEGVEVLQKIAARPVSANTEFIIVPLPDFSGDHMWLNVKFNVHLDKITWPKYAPLSPRQTAYVVGNLPDTSRQHVLAKIKQWYLEQFLADVNKGLAAITKQFEGGDLLVDDYDDGRIFDIHTERRVPYTESAVVGDQLWWKFLCAHTFLETHQDVLAKADALISRARSRQRNAVDSFLPLLRGSRP